MASLDSNPSRQKPGKDREKQIGLKQYILLQALAWSDRWYYLKDLGAKMDKGFSRNHKYFIVRDYVERGLIDRKTEIENNRPVTLIKLTYLGRAWFTYHRLGLDYDAMGALTPAQRLKYTAAYQTLLSAGFSFLRHSEADTAGLIKEYMEEHHRQARIGQQASLEL